MNLKKRKTITIILSQTVVSAGNFLSFLFMARELGLTLFGVFSIVWLVVLFSSSIVMATCVFPMMTNYLKEHESDRNYYLSGTLTYCLFICIALGLMCSFFIFSFNINEVVSLVACVIFINVQDFIRRMLIVLEKTTWALGSDLITYTSRLTLLLLTSYYSFLNITAALCIFSMSSLFGIIFTIKYIPKVDFSITSFRYSWRVNQKSGKWLLPSGLMQWTSINLFVSVAAFLISPAAVGIIRICQSVLSVFNILIQAAENIIPIRAVKALNDGGYECLIKYALKASFLGVLPFLILIAFCFVLGEELVVFVYGDKYNGLVGDTLFIYSISYVFVYLIVPVRAVLRAMDKTKVWFNAYILSSIVSMLSVNWLVINFNEVGVVIGVLIAHVTLISYAVIVIFLMCKKRF